LISGPAKELVGKRIGLFSYGSGLAASMYSISVTQDAAAFEKFVSQLDYVQPLLNSREKVAPEQFSALMEVREKNNHAAPYTPTGSISALFPGTYYLKDVDALHRRTYERTPTISNGVH